MFSSPDSALSILTSITKPEKLSKADYAAWCLHYTHARYKLHQDITSDSLIMISVNYYKNSNLKKQSGTSYYLLGCIESKLQNNKGAIDAFKKAEHILKETDENRLMGLTNFNMGYIYMQDELYNHSLNYLKKSLSYFSLSNDKNYQAYAYREISDLYYQLDFPFDSVMYSSNLALAFSKEAGDSLNYYSILSRQGELLYNKDNIRSKEFILQGYRYFPAQREYYAAYLSYLYSELKQPDSAQYYLQIALEDTSDPKSNIVKYHAAALVEMNESNYKRAYDFMETAYLFRDSVYQKNISSQLYRIDKQYDLTKIEEKNAELKIHNQRNIIFITILTIAVLSILIMLLLIRNRHKHKQAAMEMKNQQLEFEIKTERIEHEQKRQLLVAKLQNHIKNTLYFKKLKTGSLEKEKHDEFIKEITRQSLILEKDWQFYINEVNSLFGERIMYFSNKITGLTPSDLIVISLICLELDITDCCNLLDMNTNTMYGRRKRIKKHLSLDNNIDLEAWIKENIVENGNQ